MIKAIWERNTPYSQFLISVGVILLLAVAFTLVSTVLATVIYGVSMAEMGTIMNEMNSPLSLPIMRLVQTFSSIGTFVLPPFVIAYLFSQRPAEYLGLDEKPKAGAMLIVAVAMIMISPFINFLGEVNSHLHLPGYLKNVEDWMRQTEDKAAVVTKKFLEMNSVGDLLINLIMIALIPAVGEELVFRGVVQRIFGRWANNVHIGVWTAAFLFSAMHMQFYGFVPRFILGALLGYLYVWSGSLWLSMLGHFVNNAGAVLMTYLFAKGMIGVDPDKIGVENDYGSVAASVLIGGGLIFLIYKNRKPQSLPEA